MYFKPYVKYGNIIFGINYVFIGLNVWGIQLRVQRFFRGRKRSWNEEVRTKTGKWERGSRDLARDPKSRPKPRESPWNVLGLREQGSRARPRPRSRVPFIVRHATSRAG